MSYNVLIVDDSAIIRAAVKKILGMADVDLADVYEAADGAEAMVQLEQNWIDIVFADINMPVMNGLEMVTKMKERGILDTVPVVMVTTERSESRRQQLREQGVSAYLNKPFTPESIKDVLDEILGAKK